MPREKPQLHSSKISWSQWASCPEKDSHIGPGTFCVSDRSPGDSELTVKKSNNYICVIRHSCPAVICTGGERRPSIPPSPGGFDGESGGGPVAGGCDSPSSVAGSLDGDIVNCCGASNQSGQEYVESTNGLADERKRGFFRRRGQVSRRLEFVLRTLRGLVPLNFGTLCQLQGSSTMDEREGLKDREREISKPFSSGTCPCEHGKTTSVRCPGTP